MVASDRTTTTPRSTRDQLPFIARLLLPLTYQRGDGHETLDQGRGGAEGVLVKAHPDARYLYLVGLGSACEGATGAHGERNEPRTSEGLASAVGGDSHVSAHRAGVARARRGAGRLQVSVRDVPGAVPPVGDNCHAEGLPRPNEVGPLVCRYNTLSCSVSVGDRDVPLSAHASGMRRSQTLKAMLPVWPPGFVAVTLVGPSWTPPGTMNVALWPLAATIWAGTPPTAMVTLWAPNPWPVIVT